MGTVVFAAETAGREVFLGFGTGLVLLFYGLTTLAIGVFLFGFYRRIRKYTRGRASARLNWGRFIKALGDISSNRTIAACGLSRLR